MSKVITQEASISNVFQPRVEFDRHGFGSAVWEKGYNVTIESNVLCPCRGISSPQLATCQNCLGTGFVFLGAYQTKMLLMSLNANTKYREWSKENIGTVSVTALVRDYLCFMDRITVLDSLATQSETVFMKNYNGQSYCYTIYPIINIIDMFIFINENTALKRLLLNTDYTIIGNKILFTSLYPNDITISIRYKHNLQYHIIDVVHDVRNSPITQESGVKVTELFPDRKSVV